MKPERVQLFQRLVNGTEEFANQVWAMLDWIEVAVAALKRLFGDRGTDQ